MLKSKMFVLIHFSLETKSYNEKHTRTILDVEHKTVSKKLTEFKNSN